MNAAVNNTIKRSLITEHIVYNQTCGNKCEFSIFKNLCNFDLIRLEEILIHLNKLKLFKKNEFDSIIALKHSVLI